MACIGCCRLSGLAELSVSVPIWQHPPSHPPHAYAVVPLQILPRHFAQSLNATEIYLCRYSSWDDFCSNVSTRSLLLSGRRATACLQLLPNRLELGSQALPWDVRDLPWQGRCLSSCLSGLRAPELKCQVLACEEAALLHHQQISGTDLGALHMTKDSSSHSTPSCVMHHC